MTRDMVYLVRTLIVLAVTIAVWWSWHQVKDFITAPVATERDVAQASNTGFQKAAAAQNAGIDGLKKAAEARKAKSAEAVKAAGEPQFKDAERIHNAPPEGATDYERMVNRIDRELGLH